MDCLLDVLVNALRGKRERGLAHATMADCQTETLGQETFIDQCIVQNKSIVLVTATEIKMHLTVLMQFLLYAIKFISKSSCLNSIKLLA